MTMTVIVTVAMIVIPVMRVAMFLVLPVVVPVVMAVLVTVFGASEALLPAMMPGPVGALVAVGQGTGVSIPGIKPAIDIAAEVIRPVEPPARAHKHATYKPGRAIVSKGRA